MAVYSTSHPDSPNVVKLYDDGSMQCPCIMFKSSTNVFSHLVAVAEKKKNVLSIYLAWMSTSESDCNPYHLATKNVNVRASGQKAGKERRNRKTQKNPQPSFTVTNQDNYCLLPWVQTNLHQTCQAIEHWKPLTGNQLLEVTHQYCQYHKSPFVGSLSSFTPASYNMKATSPFTSQPAMPPPGVFVGPYLPCHNNHFFYVNKWKNQEVRRLQKRVFRPF